MTAQDGRMEERDWVGPKTPRNPKSVRTPKRGEDGGCFKFIAVPVLAVIAAILIACTGGKDDGEPNCTESELRRPAPCPSEWK